jgi:CheY-like chemotaxis protein
VVLAFDSAEAFLATEIPTGNVCLLLDIYLPGMNGIDLCGALAAFGRSVPTILMTANDDEATQKIARNAGVLATGAGKSSVSEEIVRPRSITRQEISVKRPPPGRPPDPSDETNKDRSSARSPPRQIQGVTPEQPRFRSGNRQHSKKQPLLAVHC